MLKGLNQIINTAGNAIAALARGRVKSGEQTAGKADLHQDGLDTSVASQAKKVTGKPTPPPVDPRFEMGQQPASSSNPTGSVSVTKPRSVRRIQLEIKGPITRENIDDIRRQLAQQLQEAFGVVVPTALVEAALYDVGMAKDHCCTFETPSFFVDARAFANVKDDTALYDAIAQVYAKELETITSEQERRTIINTIADVVKAKHGQQLQGGVALPSLDVLYDILENSRTHPGAKATMAWIESKTSDKVTSFLSQLSRKIRERVGGENLADAIDALSPLAGRVAVVVDDIVDDVSDMGAGMVARMMGDTASALDALRPELSFAERLIFIAQHDPRFKGSSLAAALGPSVATQSYQKENITQVAKDSKEAPTKTEVRAARDAQKREEKRAFARAAQNAEAAAELAQHTRQAHEDAAQNRFEVNHDLSRSDGRPGRGSNNKV